MELTLLLEWELQQHCFQVMSKNKFKIDDTLEIVKYGFLVYQPKSEPKRSEVIYSEDDEGYATDLYPEWIGLQGEVLEIVPTVKGTKYLLSTPGDPRELYEDQLIKI